MTKDQRIADLEARVRQLEAELVRREQQQIEDRATISAAATPLIIPYSVTTTVTSVRFPSWPTWTTYGRPPDWHEGES